jgi:Zn-dependent protease with chaperone function
MYYLLGICLVFVSLLALNVLSAVAAALLWRIIKQPTRRWSSAPRARLIFALRTAPAACSLICVVALLLPAYLVHEPQHSTETVSAKLAVISLLSLFWVALLLWRTFAAWRATRMLITDWLLHAEPISIGGVNIPTYKLPHTFPVIALVGILRPKLFIASQLFDVLDEEEIRAALLHEEAHLMARDNFKRPLMRACCGVLKIAPSSRAIERRWAEEAERAADEYAARIGGAASALSLASALIKVARLAPEGGRPAMPVGSFFIGESDTQLADRVRHLTWLASQGAQRQASATRLRLFNSFLSCSLFVILYLLITQTNILVTLHAIIEFFVAALQ